MCLYITNDESKCAEKDIYCYKVVINANSEYKTPIAGYKLPNSLAGYTQEEPLNNAVINLFCIGTYRCLSIYGGVIHSIKKLKSARSLFNKKIYNNLEIWKCIIPKGTIYYEGIINIGNYGYASKKLKYLYKIS